MGDRTSRAALMAAAAERRARKLSKRQREEDSDDSGEVEILGARTLEEKNAIGFSAAIDIDAIDSDEEELRDLMGDGFVESMQQPPNVPTSPAQPLLP